LTFANDREACLNLRLSVRLRRLLRDHPCATRTGYRGAKTNCPTDIESSHDEQQ